MVSQIIESPFKDKYDAVNLEKSAMPVMADIVVALETVGITSISYAVKSRVKKEADLLEKIQRKRDDDKPDYKLTDITDVIGVRLVSLFREDMIDLFRRVVELINHVEKLNPNPFQKNSFEEVIIYSPYEHDSLTARIKLLSNSVLKDSVEIKDEISSEGYSSIHIVCRAGNPLSLSEGEIDLPVEIQIRTVFEDAWGEIDHKFRYANDEGKRGVKINNPIKVAESLKILKKFSDSCSLFADEIKRDAIKYSKGTCIVPNINPVDTSEEVKARLIESGCPSEDIDKYQDLRNILYKYSKDKNNSSRTLQLVAAAGEFLDLSRAISSRCKDNEIVDEDYFKFHFSMNAALCLISTFDEKNLHIALDIYKSILELDKNNPMVSLRVAQTLLALGYIHESLKEFELLISRIDDLKSKYAHESEISHIKKYTPHLFGYALWMQFNAQDENEKDINIIIKALEVANSYDFEQDSELKGTYRNNILYYYYEYAMTDSDILTEDIHEKIADQIAKIKAENQDYDKNIDILDTLARSHYAIGDFEGCVSYCEYLQHLAFSGGPNNEDFSHEWELLQSIHALKSKALEKKVG